MKMKTWLLVVIVVLLHCGVVCALMVLQGCGTAGGRQAPPAVVMPPLPPPEDVTVFPTGYPVGPIGKKVYKVKPGDSISRIAQRYNVSQAEIVALNKLPDPNKIRVGQSLFLPEYVKLDEPAAKAAPAPAADSGNVYVVQHGDSISKIARRLGVSEDDLVMLNNLSDRNKISVGQRLVVPAGAKSVAPAAYSRSQAGPAQPAELSEAATIEESVGSPEPTIAGTQQAPEHPALSEFVHIVEPGQDLKDIAALYVVTVEELAELNGLSPTNELEVGARLKIP